MTSFNLFINYYFCLYARICWVDDEKNAAQIAEEKKSWIRRKLPKKMTKNKKFDLFAYWASIIAYCTHRTKANIVIVH